MLQQAAIAIISTRHNAKCLLMTPDLEHERFDNELFINALSAFARSSRYTKTQILLADTRLAIEDGHRVIKLVRRLSSLDSKLGNCTKPI
jgi:hypothetical protein